MHLDILRDATKIIFNLAKRTGCFGPGCKFNIESIDVLLPLSVTNRRTNSSHPLCGWWLTQKYFLHNFCAMPLFKVRDLRFDLEQQYLLTEGRSTDVHAFFKGMNRI